MKAFVRELTQLVLQPMPEVNLQTVRAHQLLTAKPRIPTAAPRSLIVKFLDYSVKAATLRQAWSQRQLLYKAKPIFFDHDYSPEVQKKRTHLQSNS